MKTRIHRYFKIVILGLILSMLSPLVGVLLSVYVIRKSNLDQVFFLGDRAVVDRFLVKYTNFIYGTEVLVNFSSVDPDSTRMANAQLASVYSRGFPQVLATRSRMYGIPWRSLQYSSSLIAVDKGKRISVINDAVVLEGRAGIDWYKDAYVIPTDLLWAGVIKNAFFWIILCGMVQYSLHFIRSKFAIHGICKFCGYPIGSKICPECGSNVRPELQHHQRG